MISLGAGSPFSDGYQDGLLDRSEFEYLYPTGRARQKYLDGVRCGEDDRTAGALEPIEPLT